MSSEEKIKIEGNVNISANTIRCVCGHCGNNDNENAVIEFNFQEQRVIYLCSKCKKENGMPFGKERAIPYPRMGIGN